MTLLDILKRSASRLSARNVRKALAGSRPLPLGLLELERRETPAAPPWLVQIGIQSDGLGLTGKDIGIGVFEAGRPGVANFDARWNATVTPTEVAIRDGGLTKNEGLPDRNDHATQVTGILIRSGNTYGGIVQDAKVYVSGFAPGPAAGPVPLEHWVRTFQHLAKRNNDDVAAINVSVSRRVNAGDKFDGSSDWTKAVDYVSATHDTLIVVSGSNDAAADFPRDAYNILTVREAKRTRVPAGEEIQPNNQAFVYQTVAKGTNLQTDEPAATRRNLTQRPYGRESRCEPGVLSV